MADPTAGHDGVSLIQRLADDARAHPPRSAPELAQVQRRVAVRHRRRRTAAGLSLLVPLLVVGLVWLRVGRPDRDQGTLRTEQPEQPAKIEDRAPDRSTTSAPTPGDVPLGLLTFAELGVASEALAPSPLSAREAMVSAWTGEEFLIWGGSAGALSDGGQNRVLDDGAAYDPASDTWRTLAPSPLSGRARSSSVWSGTELYVWGGSADATGVGGLLDGAAYRPDTDTWRRIASAPAGTDRSFGSAAWVAGRMVIGGGSVPTGPASSVVVYDPGLDAWSTVSTPGTVATVVASGDRVAVLLVPADSLTDRVTVAWLDPTTSDLVAGPTVEAGDGLMFDHVGGVWTGDELVVGAMGTGSPGVLAVVGPNGEAWTSRRQIADDRSLAWPRAIGFMPSPDLLAWTGSHAVSFGTGGGEVSMYDPTSGQVAFGYAGQCGYDGASVWTGDEVLTWGGQSCRAGSSSRQTAEGLRLRLTP